MSLLTLLKENYHKLNKNDLRIYSFIAQNKQEVVDLSINQLANILDLSTSAIMSFTKKLDLEGYSELRYLVKWSEDDSDAAFDDNEIEYTKNDINLTMTMLISLNLSPFFEKLNHASNIFVLANGYTQLNVAEELKRNFLNVGKIVNIIDDARNYKSYLDIFEDGDVIFVISFNGENKGLINFIKGIDKDVCVASITKLSNNTLSHLSDYNISFITHEVYDFDQKMKIAPISHFYVVIDFIILKYLSYINGRDKD